MPSRFRHIWAKSPAEDGSAGESLGSHTQRVWGNFVACYERAPDLDHLCRMPRFWVRAALAVLVHDVGKCCAGFQGMLRQERDFHERHEVLSTAVLPLLLGDDPEGDLPWVAATILSHHKDLEEIYSRYRPADLLLGTPDGLHSLEPELDQDFYETAAGLLEEEIVPLAEGSPFQKLAGIADALDGGAPPGHLQVLRSAMSAAFSLWDRIEHADYRSEEALAGRFLRGLLLIADHAGSARERIAHCSLLASGEGVLAGVGRRECDLHDHQKEARRLTSSGILIAPTGSGKTEASLLWAAAAYAGSRGRPVLFYVLPYQASLNAMRQRLGAVFGHATVALQHSRALQAIYKVLLEKDYAPATAARLASRETALARLHATPVRLLTPYQLLRAAFQLKGHEAIWTDAARGLMIFDELHAYETNRLGMILATLIHLVKDSGVRTLVMSATLPGLLSTLLQECLPDIKLIWSSEATFAKFRRHRLHLMEQDLLEEESIRRIVSDARRGRSVLTVCTTVGRAQDLWQELRKVLGSGVGLLHGRFNADDRFSKEMQLLQQRESSNGGAVVLVATQVVEVSLDIDFDVLYSDPAPFEALVQRMGRVNRHRRHAERDVFVMRAIPEGCPVYPESLIQASLQALQAFDGQLLDESLLQGALDKVYGGEFGKDWQAQVRLSMQEFERSVLRSLKPFRSDEGLREKFEQMFDGFEVLPAGLETAYWERINSEPMRAPGLLVPITSGQYFMLKWGEQVRWRGGVCVAECPYGPILGLELQRRSEVDGV